MQRVHHVKLSFDSIDRDVSENESQRHQEVPREAKNWLQNMQVSLSAIVSRRSHTYLRWAGGDA